MINKARIIDVAKNIAIVLLLCSTVFLLLQAVTTSPRHFLDGLFGSRSTVSEQESRKNAARAVPSLPIAIVLTGEDSDHFVAKYDYQAKERLYAQFSASLGEALGTSSSPKAIKEADWRTALRRAGVYFEYHRAMPLEVIALHLGTQFSSPAGEVLARRLFLGQFGSSLCLYYIDESDGSFYRMDTALSYSAVSERLKDSSLSRGSFAFEADGTEYSLLDPYFIFSKENAKINALSSSTALLSLESGLVSLESFGMNERASRNHPERDGSVVYVDGNKSLRISIDGSALFTVTGSGGLPVEHSGSYPTLNECIAAAAELVSTTLAPNSGIAEVGLIGVEPGVNRGSWTLSFGYYVNGVPLEVSNTGWCAKIRISGGYIVRAELIYRQYTLLTESLAIMPENMAVINAIQRDGGEPILIYSDAFGTVSGNWVLNSDSGV